MCVGWGLKGPSAESEEGGPSQGREEQAQEESAKKKLEGGLTARAPAGRTPEGGRRGRAGEGPPGQETQVPALEGEGPRLGAGRARRADAGPAAAETKDPAVRALKPRRLLSALWVGVRRGLGQSQLRAKPTPPEAPAFSVSSRHPHPWWSRPLHRQGR